MLVLSRKEGEEIVIAGTIRVVILESKNRSVRVGITAPKDVPVHRSEVQERARQPRADRRD